MANTASKTTASTAAQKPSSEATKAPEAEGSTEATTSTTSTTSTTTVEATGQHTQGTGEAAGTTPSTAQPKEAPVVVDTAQEAATALKLEGDVKEPGTQAWHIVNNYPPTSPSSADQPEWFVKGREAVTAHQVSSSKALDEARATEVVTDAPKGGAGTGLGTDPGSGAASSGEGQGKDQKEA